jgi:hypothetical protein
MQLVLRRTSWFILSPYLLYNGRNWILKLTQVLTVNVRIHLICVGFLEIHTKSVKYKVEMITVFWIVTPYSLENIIATFQRNLLLASWRYKSKLTVETYGTGAAETWMSSLRLYHSFPHWGCSFCPKMEAALSSERPVKIYQITSVTFSPQCKGADDYYLGLRTSPWVPYTTTFRKMSASVIRFKGGVTTPQMTSEWTDLHHLAPNQTVSRDNG